MYPNLQFLLLVDFLTLFPSSSSLSPFFFLSVSALSLSHFACSGKSHFSIEKSLLTHFRRTFRHFSLFIFSFGIQIASLCQRYAFIKYQAGVERRMKAVNYCISQFVLILKQKIEREIQIDRQRGKGEKERKGREEREREKQRRGEGEGDREKAGKIEKREKARESGKEQYAQTHIPCRNSYYYYRSKIRLLKKRNPKEKENMQFNTKNSYDGRECYVNIFSA